MQQTRCKPGRDRDYCMLQLTFILVVFVVLCCHPLSGLVAARWHHQETVLWNSSSIPSRP